MNIFKSAYNWFGDHQSESLTGIGIALGVAAVVSAAVAAVKTKEEIDTVRYEREGIEPSKKEKAFIGAKHFTPTVIFASASVGCHIGAEVINHKRVAAITAAAALSEKTLKDYIQNQIEATKEVVGEEKAKEIQEKTEEKHKERPTRKVKTDIGITKYKFVENVLGHEFLTSKVEVDTVINRLNKELLTEGRVPYSRFYEELGYPEYATDVADDLQWEASTMKDIIEADYSSYLDDNGVPYILIEFYPNAPRRL